MACSLRHALGDACYVVQSADQKDRERSELRIKAAQCCTEMQMVADALAELEAIDKPARTLKVHFTMARLYRDLGKDTAAFTAYQVSRCHLTLGFLTGAMHRLRMCC